MTTHQLAQALFRNPDNVVDVEKNVLAVSHLVSAEKDGQTIIVCKPFEEKHD